ncbi:hypothetical protein R2F25_37755 [Streptomyces sp. UP1A-1]|nr:hypothetical protein [Streptomyces sp. UP1A-1]
MQQFGDPDAGAVGALQHALRRQAQAQQRVFVRLRRRSGCAGR